MLGEAPGPINFTVFLTLMADKLTGTDPEHVITSAFAAFDTDNTGTIDADYLRECMTTMGDRFTDEEVSVRDKGNTHQFIFCCFRWMSCLKAQLWTIKGSLITGNSYGY
jgi:hypothetical protein